MAEASAGFVRLVHRRDCNIGQMAIISSSLVNLAVCIPLSIHGFDSSVVVIECISICPSFPSHLIILFALIGVVNLCLTRADDTNREAQNSVATHIIFHLGHKPQHLFFFHIVTHFIKFFTMVNLFALGFCGADDTVNPRHLALLAQAYPTVEWGILFRPDKEGQPRYATKEWVQNLSDILQITSGGKGRLAAHLCGEHVDHLLNSDYTDKIDAFLKQLYQWGFRRVQVNATAVNGVFTDHLAKETTIQSFIRSTNAHPLLEFIVQKNEETQPLWEGLLKAGRPRNMVFLHDESKGTGKVCDGGWCDDAKFVSTDRRIVGFAGVSFFKIHSFLYLYNVLYLITCTLLTQGIKPTNIQSSIENALEACDKSGAKEFWIDMESGVRTKLLGEAGDNDIFDLSKCYECIDIVCGMGLLEHPSS